MAVEPRFIHCPHCNGFSYTVTPGGHSVACPHCSSNQSTVMEYDDDLVVWKTAYTPIALHHRRLHTWLGYLLDIVCIVLGIAGVIGLWSVLSTALTDQQTVWELLTEQSSSRLIFWVSLFFDLWLFTRVERMLQRVKPIRPWRRLRGIETTALTDWELIWPLVKKVSIDASASVHPEAERSIIAAHTLAGRWHQPHVTPAHLLYSLLDTTDVKAALNRLEVSLPDLQRTMQRVALHEQGQSTAHLTVALLYAYAQARAAKRNSISALELLVGCVSADELLRDAFDDVGVTMTELQNVVHWGNVVRDLLQRERRRRQLAQYKPKTTMNIAMTARPTYTLDSISQDFTLMARYNHFLPTVGRAAEVNEAFRILQEGHTSVMLLGDPGVGKSTILEGIADLMTAEDVPASLQDKRLVVTNPGALIAGAGNIGGLEQRMETVIHEIMQAGNIIWCIEDIHTLLGAGSTGSNIDIGKILMNYISQGYIKVIGTTTTREYEQFIEPHEAFNRRFQQVKIRELQPADAILVLEGRAPFIEGKHGVYFTYQALADCVNLSERYIKDRHLPAKALDIMTEAAVLAREQAGKVTLVTKEHVAQVIAEKTNVAVTSITASEGEKLLHLEEFLHEHVIGQDEAISAIAKALRRAREDVRDLTRPIASLLFLGPTGVGKTETAKAIAKVYFGDEQRLMRFDMSEFDTPETVGKLIGLPGQPGALTEAIRQKPFSIILLDELEKAHRDILNIFLQVMEDGRLTDGSGYTADFTNAMLIATSNAATTEIQELYNQGVTPAVIQEQLLESNLLKQWFTPEFINRFDHVAVFTPLTADELFKIAELLLQKLAGTMVEKGMTLRWTPEAVTELVKLGYHPQYGARPLRRVIQDQVQDAVAQLLLQQKLSRRDIIELHPGGKLRVYKAERI